jgi:DNA processing protein
LVTDAAEVAEEVGPIGELAPRKEGPSTPDDDLAPSHQAVLAALPTRNAVPAEDLARRCGLAAHEVRGALGALDVAGLALREGDGWRKPAVRH